MNNDRQILNFKTNVLLKSIIGKDLINDDNIAVLELVKNSFDAGSPSVTVTFKNIKNNDDNIVAAYSNLSSKIIIQDFGVGMDDYDIKNKWLNIAYSEKKAKKTDNNRLLAGNKGVGRFSCDRLGQFLDLYTKTEADSKYYHLKINWNDFETDTRKDLSEVEKKDLEIQEINVFLFEINQEDFEQQTGYKRFDQGVILEISKLRSQWATKTEIKNKVTWNIDKLLKLKNYLEKLVNPNQAFQANKFIIELIALEFDNEPTPLSGEVKNRIFDKLEFTATCIDSVIDPLGETILTSITDKGRLIFLLEEKNTAFKLLKDIRIILYYLNTYSKIYFAKQTGIRSVDFGSVFLFINGFMIPPYGEEGNDWLGLEIRRGQGHNRFLSTRELVGRVEIKDSQNNFKIVSSREGVVNDVYFQQLTGSVDNKKGTKEGYFYHTLKRLEKYVVDGLKWDRITGDDDLQEDESISKRRAKIIKDFEARTQSISPIESTRFETYYESELEKKKRVFSIINNIIDVKKENIIDLYINEDLILELAKAEEAAVQKNIDSLLKEIENLQSTDIDSWVKKIEANRNSARAVFDKINSINSSNEKTLSAIKASEEMYAQFENNFTTFKQLIERLTIEKRIAEEKALQEAVEKAQLEANLEAERQKNIYLLATRRALSEDADGLMHTVKINSAFIKDSIDNIIEGITSNSYTQTEILRKLGNIKVYSEKSLLVAEIATRSNFKEDIERRNVDVVQYIIQYITLYGSNDLKYTFEGQSSQLFKKISILDLSIVIDNLISNSIKWKSTEIIFSFENIDTNLLRIQISDNGEGLSNNFLKNPELIFELGVGNTPSGGKGGSGIGLYFTRELLKQMYGEIKFIGNGIKLKGATFEIILRKPI